MLAEHGCTCLEEAENGITMMMMMMMVVNMSNEMKWHYDNFACLLFS